MKQHWQQHPHAFIPPDLQQQFGGFTIQDPSPGGPGPPHPRHHTPGQSTPNVHADQAVAQDGVVVPSSVQLHQGVIGQMPKGVSDGASFLRMLQSPAAPAKADSGQFQQSHGPTGNQHNPSLDVSINSGRGRPGLQGSSAQWQELSPPVASTALAAPQPRSSSMVLPQNMSRTSSGTADHQQQQMTQQQVQQHDYQYQHSTASAQRSQGYEPQYLQDKHQRQYTQAPPQQLQNQQHQPHQQHYQTQQATAKHPWMDQHAHQDQQVDGWFDQQPRLQAGPQHGLQHFNHAFQHGQPHDRQQHHSQLSYAQQGHQQQPPHTPPGQQHAPHHQAQQSFPAQQQPHQSLPQTHNHQQGPHQQGLHPPPSHQQQQYGQQQYGQQQQHDGHQLQHGQQHRQQQHGQQQHGQQQQHAGQQQHVGQQQHAGQQQHDGHQQQHGQQHGQQQQQGQQAEGSNAWAAPWSATIANGIWGNSIWTPGESSIWSSASTTTSPDVQPGTSAAQATVLLPKPASPHPPQLSPPSQHSHSHAAPTASGTHMPSQQQQQQQHQQQQHQQQEQYPQHPPGFAPHVLPQQPPGFPMPGAFLTQQLQGFPQPAGYLPHMNMAMATPFSAGGGMGMQHPMQHMYAQMAGAQMAGAQMGGGQMGGAAHSLGQQMMQLPSHVSHGGPQVGDHRETANGHRAMHQPAAPHSQSSRELSQGEAGMAARSGSSSLGSQRSQDMGHRPPLQTQRSSSGHMDSLSPHSRQPQPPPRMGHGPPPPNLSLLDRPLLELSQRLTPREEEVAKLQGAFDTIKQMLLREWPVAKVHLFGSAANGLSICDNNDIDVCLELPEPGPAEPPLDKGAIIERVEQLLQEAGMRDILGLPKARVPVCKCTLPASTTRVDVSCGNMLAIVNTKLLKDYACIDPRLKQLVLLVKHWAKQRKVNDSYRGTLSSYAYVLLCIFFLQTRRPPVLPVLQAFKPTFRKTIGGWCCDYCDDIERLRNFGAQNREGLGELLAAFFCYWDSQHDYSNSVVSIRTGKLLSKSEKDWTRRVGRERHLVCIEDPFDISHDLGRTIDPMTSQTLRREFRRAATVLMNDSDPLHKLFEPLVRH